MNILDHALSLVPGYEPIEPDAERVSGLRKQLQRLNLPLAHELAVQAYNDAISTSTDISEIIEARRAVLRAAEDSTIGATIGHPLDGDLARHAKSTVRDRSGYGDDAVAPALEFLHTRLQDLLSEVLSAADTLDGIRSAEDALHGTTAQQEAWRALDGAQSAYSEIRSAQRHLVTGIAGHDFANERPLLSLFNNHGARRDAFDSEAAYLHARKPLIKQGWRNDPRVDPWLEWREAVTAAKWTRVNGDTWPEEGTRLAYLIDLAKSGNAWVPTIAQLEEAGSHVSTMLRTINHAEDLRDALDAYDAYYRDVRPAVRLNTESIRAALPEQKRRAAGRRRVEDPPQGLDPRLAKVLR